MTVHDTSSWIPIQEFDNSHVICIQRICTFWRDAWSIFADWTLLKFHIAIGMENGKINTNWWILLFDITVNYNGKLLHACSRNVIISHCENAFKWDTSLSAIFFAIFGPVNEERENATREKNHFAYARYFYRRICHSQCMLPLTFNHTH